MAENEKGFLGIGGKSKTETIEELEKSVSMWKTGAIVAAGAFAIAVGWIIWGK